MDLLIDTHSYIWFATNSTALSSIAKNIMENEHNKLYLSLASIWEMGIKISLGKLSIGASFEDLLAEVSASGIAVLPISTEHVLRSTQLPFHHRDPFDRMIVAQALCEQMNVVGCDTAFDPYFEAQAIKRIW
jgi:PIN domain nuclease of toxin-antitoxin system